VSRSQNPVLVQSGTLWETIQAVSKDLQGAGIEHFRLEAERLIAYALEMSRVDLFMDRERRLGSDDEERIRSLIDRRMQGEPLQYITGLAEFMSLPFAVDPRVLIPRPETETLVEAVVGRFSRKDPVVLCDIGVGSGAVAVSLARNLPESVVLGVDVSQSALDLAGENAVRNDVVGRVVFRRADVRIEPFDGWELAPFDAVVSNPPYVSQEEWGKLPVEIREHEPRVALCDEGDGLTFFRLIARKSGGVLKPGGWLFLETGDSQGRKVMAILEESGYEGLEILPDLGGIGRVVKGQKGISLTERRNHSRETS